MSRSECNSVFSKWHENKLNKTKLYLKISNKKKVFRASDLEGIGDIMLKILYLFLIWSLNTFFDWVLFELLICLVYFRYWETLVHMLKASLGTGILAMPDAFHNAGYVVATIGTIVIGFLCTYTIHILVSYLESFFYLNIRTKTVR